MFCLGSAYVALILMSSKCMNMSTKKKKTRNTITAKTVFFSCFFHSHWWIADCNNLFVGVLYHSGRLLTLHESLRRLAIGVFASVSSVDFKCSTRFTVLQRVGMSHAINWKKIQYEFIFCGFRSLRHFYIVDTWNVRTHACRWWDLQKTHTQKNEWATKVFSPHLLYCCHTFSSYCRFRRQH